MIDSRASRAPMSPPDQRRLARAHVDQDVPLPGSGQSTLRTQDHFTHVARKTDNGENHIAQLGHLLGTVGPGGPFGQ